MTRLFAFNFIVSLLLVPIASVSAGGPAAPEILDSPEIIVAPGVSPSKLRFERKQFTLSRQRGDIRFDGTLVDSQAVANGDQRIRLIETFDHVKFKNDSDFRRWTRRLRSTRTYTYDDVIQMTENGSTTRQPLVLLPSAERPAAERQWGTWLAMKSDDAMKATDASEAEQSGVARGNRELASALKQLLSVSPAIAGRSHLRAAAERVIGNSLDLWDVRLVPTTNRTFGAANVAFNRGVYFSSPNYVDGISVRVIAEDSQFAIYQALRQNPGYRLSSARKL